MKVKMVSLAIAALAALVSLVSLPVLAQTQKLPIPSGVCTTAGQLLAATDGNNVQCTSSPSIGTSLTVGSGTAITKIAVYSPSVSPSSVAATSCAEQAVTVSGVTTGDKIVVNPPFMQAPTTHGGVSVVAARPETDAVALTFCNVWNAAETPEGGTYTIVAFRS